MKSGENVNGVWVREFNTDTNTYTERTEDGEVTVARPLTPEEIEFLTAPQVCGSCGQTIGG